MVASTKREADLRSVIPDLDGLWKKITEELFWADGKLVDMKGLPGYLSDKLKTILGSLKGILEDILQIGNAATPFLKRVLGKFIEFISDFAEEILKAFEKMLGEIDKHLEPFGSVPGKLIAVVTEILKFAAKWWGKALAHVMKAMGALADDGAAFVKKIIDEIVVKWIGEKTPRFLDGPLSILNALTEYINLMGGEMARIEKRLEAVFAAFEDAYRITHGNTGSRTPPLYRRLLRTFKEHLGILLKAQPDDVAKHWARIALFPFDILHVVLRAGVDPRWNMFDAAPTSFKAGDFNEWINYDVGSPDSEENDIKREYKVGLVSEIDSLLREAVGGDDVASRQRSTLDGRDSSNILVDLVSRVLGYTTCFIFQPNCYPVGRVDWPEYDNVGFEFSRSFSRQFQAEMKIFVGSFLRGFWAWSVGNKNLIEGIGAIFGSIISGIVEGIARSVTWTFDIRTVYPPEVPEKKKGRKLGPLKSATEVVLHEWKSGETVYGFQSPTSRNLLYRAYFRDGAAEGRRFRDGAVGRLSPGGLKGVIEDLGAYMDIAYLRFRHEDRFKQPDALETVVVTQADIVNAQGKRTVHIRATTTRKYEDPKPVLRAYCCCETVVMNPGAGPADAYHCIIPVDSMASPSQVTVLSNRGGVRTRGIYRRP